MEGHIGRAVELIIKLNMIRDGSEFVAIERELAKGARECVLTTEKISYRRIQVNTCATKIDV